MSATLPRRRSLAFLAFLSLAMVVGSYTVVLAIAAVCTFVPLWLLLNSDGGAQVLVLLICGVAMSGTMLWSLFPRHDKFKQPGPLLDPSAHPQLFNSSYRKRSS